MLDLTAIFWFGLCSAYSFAWHGKVADQAAVLFFDPYCDGAAMTVAMLVHSFTNGRRRGAGGGTRDCLHQYLPVMTACLFTQTTDQTFPCTRFDLVCWFQVLRGFQTRRQKRGSDCFHYCVSAGHSCLSVCSRLLMTATSFTAEGPPHLPNRATFPRLQSRSLSLQSRPS